MSNDTCTFGRCPKPLAGDEFCERHAALILPAREMFRPGSPARANAAFWSNVEKGPGCWEWLGSKVKGHGRTGVEGVTVYAHRYSWELVNDPIPEGMEIDHKCHNRGCVNPDHLRVVTPKQNNENRAGANPNSKSGVRGVHWRHDAQKWQVTIHATPKTYHVGYFTDIKEAEAAAIAKRNELFTHNDVDRRAS